MNTARNFKKHSLYKRAKSILQLTLLTSLTKHVRATINMIGDTSYTGTGNLLSEVNESTSA
jgi:hypothetical protein